jgi:uncharacterized membrane protein YoaK (UPF0700 family)
LKLARAGDQTELGLVLSLLLMTSVSGLVDAASYLQFGHIFVANMTGNIVFLGFALAGAAGVSLPNSAVALIFFSVGALATARAAGSMPATRSTMVMLVTGTELTLVLVAVLIVLITRAGSGLAAYAVVAVLAAAMGIQSTATSRINLPGFNSTVVLTTMLGTMVDSVFEAEGARVIL